ncbi:MAG: amino acid ABC transporter substrate-binding protein [Clostridia bacterium]|nr:amino acid ABC transporter substrate-binding protein [Clostridia bacterium]
MKKFLAVLLAVLMVFAICSCEKKVDEQQSENEETENVVDAPEENAEEAGEEAGDDAGEEAGEDETPAENSTITMATNAYFKPYEFYEGDKIVGIDAEIAEEIAKKLGKELVIEDMEFSTIITAVQEGSVDFGMAGMTVTEERKESVDFSSSYANGVQSIIVKEDSPITSVDDLYADGASYKVGVQLGTTGDIYSTDDFGEDNVIQYSKGNEAVLALVGGSVDCVIIDDEPAKALVAENEGLKILDTSYADEDYAICVAKGNGDLLAAINAAIDELTLDGTIDAIVAKYIK